MTVGIVGLGLIGGSLARSIKVHTDFEVLGMDINSQTMLQANLLGAIDGTLTEDNLARCDVVLVALYPAAIVTWITEHQDAFRPGAWVIDCGGVKEAVCTPLNALAQGKPWHYCGGHPMAGKERSGFDASEASLFYNASYILVPGEAPQSATDTLVSLAKSMGFGTIKYCTQQKHDRMIAYTSQIPHVLACAYVMSPRCDEHSGFSAGSYRDVSRVARINAELWADLFLANREELADETEELVRNIERIRAAVAKNDRAELVALLSSAREKKEKFG